MYLPNGTYLVRNTITWKVTSHGNGCGPHMIGQSRKGTVIKLAKGTCPLGTEGLPVIRTGAGDENNFSKGIFNLTVLIDSNNAGAIGVLYVSDNNGMMSDVDVISADGKGMYGIQAAWYSGSLVGGNGPFIIRRTYIKGFDYGIRTGGSEGEMISWRGGADNQINRCATGTPRPSGQNSAVTGPHRKRLRGVSDKPLIFLIDLAFCLENCVFFARLLRIVVQITIEGQAKIGIWASSNDLFIDSLTSYNKCVAVQAEAPVMLTNAVLNCTGTNIPYAIRNFHTASFFRDIKAPGYNVAISSAGTVKAPLVTSFDEYTPVPPTSLFGTRTRSINLPAKYPPVIPWEPDFTKWAFIEDYKINGRTDVQALQAAIDDPAKTTICLARGKVYQIDAPVYLRGAIRRIYAAGGMFHKVNSNGMIVVSDGTEPAVIIEKESIDNCDSNPGPCLPIYKRTSRTLVLESLNMNDFHIEGAGDAFITDITSGRDYVNHAQARVYVWQWEGSCCIDSTLTVTSGMVRAVGGYDEGNGSMMYFLGGISEVLGYWEYSTSCNLRSKYIMAVRNDADVSVVGLFQQNFCNPWAGYTRLVSETRNSVTKVLGNAAGAGDVVCPSGGNISLFAAYDSTRVSQALSSAARQPHVTPQKNRRTGLFINRKTAGTEVVFSTTSGAPVTILAHDMQGRIISPAKASAVFPGSHRVVLPQTAGVVGIALTSQDVKTSRLIVVQ
jgi:hypothetical protein